MIAYILDNKTLRVKDYFPFRDYSLARDVEFSQKSSVTAPYAPEAENKDFVILKDDDGEELFFGILETGKEESGSESCRLTLKQPECLFDQEIFADSEALLTTGVEDFIAEAIRANWTGTGDAMDKSYLQAVCESHTPAAAALGTIVTVEEGTYNLKTFLGNALERYRVRLGFSLADTSPREASPKLRVRIYADTAEAVPIDTDVTDISECVETFSVDVLARLFVRWKQPDVTDALGNVTAAGQTVSRSFYLTAGRSVTEDPDDPDRVDGVTKCRLIEADTESAMLEEVTNEFRSNSYQHKISFRLRKGSALYQAGSYYAGRLCTVETRRGVKTSMITATLEESGAATKQVTLGKLKVTLTERLGGRKNG